MNFQISVLVVLVGGIGLMGSSILINSVSALPNVKIMLPSYCDRHPDKCQVIALPDLTGILCPPFCPVIKDKDFWPDPWPIIQKLKPDESVVVMPFGGNGTAVAITVPTKDIQISNTTQNQ